MAIALLTESLDRGVSPGVLNLIDPFDLNSP